ncbi:MAG: thiamine pyrophosphate-dependent dehydrogenase E1 component subunit alpha [Actinomycetota bacterium]|nr:thiamine pyrophosphate-dependent dehydrogenase E1 component subunit alpha [Actinomycetota bacterium]
MTETRTAHTGEEAARGLELYESMLTMRDFEQHIYDAFSEGHVRGPTHLGLGQEAIAAGFAAVLRPDDSVVGTYRGHDHVIGRGVPVEQLAAEIFGRSSGICGGKGGSMHLQSVPHGHYGSYAIVGAHLPIACGLAWSARLRHVDEVTLCFFGDGTTNIGAFHEALNLAAVWKLPLVFVCENNLYMEYTPIATVTAVERPAADRSAAYGLEPIVVDGNNVEAVRSCAESAVARARAGEGPSLIEALTYRHHGHSRADPAKYRPEDEVGEWVTKDPIAAYRKVLESRGVTAADLDELETTTADAVKAAFDRALEATAPDTSELSTDMWADGASKWRS